MGTCPTKAFYRPNDTHKAAGGFNIPPGEVVWQSGAKTSFARTPVRLDGSRVTNIYIERPADAPGSDIDFRAQADHDRRQRGEQSRIQPENDDIIREQAIEDARQSCIMTYQMTALACASIRDGLASMQCSTNLMRQAAQNC